MDMYFRQFWTDPRLAFERRPTLSKLVLGKEEADLFWEPDTFFVNEKSVNTHKRSTGWQFNRNGTFFGPVFGSFFALLNLEWNHKSRNEPKSGQKHPK